MGDPRCIPRAPALSAAILAVGLSAIIRPAPAQSSPLRARIESEGALYFAGEPIRVRFTLTNTGDAPFTLKVRNGVPAPEGAAVFLSDAHVFNFENEQGVWVGPAGAPGRLELSLAALSRDAPADIVLGPRTAVSREIDIAKYFPRLKTPGEYDVVWRPCGGAVGSNPLRIRVAVRKEVVLKTDAGEIVLELFYDKAPQTCLHFVKLVENGFYDGLTFHRVVEGSLIQGGGLDTAGRSRHAAEIPAEFNSVEHRAGVVSMARKVDPGESAVDAPRKAFADSARSQFFICLGRIREWDGRFTAFARVRLGIEAAMKIGRAPADAATGKPKEPILIQKATTRPATKP
jgi:cyclophilin family peptidyl-prolyl cis-trans isomerase